VSSSTRPLDYEIHPCIPSCGPAVGCSNLLQADLVLLKRAGMTGVYQVRHLVTKVYSCLIRVLISPHETTVHPGVPTVSGEDPHFILDKALSTVALKVPAIIII